MFGGWVILCRNLKKLLSPNTRCFDLSFGLVVLSLKSYRVKRLYKGGLMVTEELVGWKAIAEYLKVSLETARRWAFVVATRGGIMSWEQDEGRFSNPDLWFPASVIIIAVFTIVMILILR